MNDPIAVFMEMAAEPGLFLEHVDFTARQTGFRRELVEKDFFCSVVLLRLSRSLPPTVVFKGGTCLSKVYAGFYRLSEDLDYSIPLAVDASRAERRKHASSLTRAVEQLTDGLPSVHVISALRGANESSQYIGTWGYRSVVSGAIERVKVEFSLREPGLLRPEDRDAGTLLQNALTATGLVAPFKVRAMALSEMWAEKTRAALTRAEPAIRDYFDLDYARGNTSLDLGNNGFVDLVRKKLSVPGTGHINLSPERHANLKKQVEGQLRPVLRPSDFDRFDLERILAELVKLAKRLAESS